MKAEDYAERIGRVGGYAPGNYFGKCSICEREFAGDKRAIHCLPCAIAQLVAERDALRVSLTWQPIETAPKAKGWLFLFVPGHGPARAIWSKRKTGDEYGWVGHGSGRYITRGTHWMPIPEPPSIFGGMDT